MANLRTHLLRVGTKRSFYTPPPPGRRALMLLGT